jgi:5-methylcytosine-specific restriction endonuclease McrA
MAENGETRDPSSHRTPGQIKRQDRGYNHGKDQIDKRTDLGRNRRDFEKRGLVRKGDGKDIDHRIPYSKGGSNDRSNLHVMDRSANRRKGTSPPKK